MNILPKKRWHVRTRENIARVRKDEAAAAEEAKEQERRVLLAEQEARTRFLRQKARQICDYQPDKDESSASPAATNKHVNFFEELEEGLVVLSKKNAEAEREKKEEKEKYEKQIGYLTYLGQDTVESTGKVPWYDKVPAHCREQSSGVDVEASSKSKSQLDPLNTMKSYLSERVDDVKRACMDPVKNETHIRKRKMSFDSDLKSRKKKKKSKHKHKKSKKHKHRKESSDDSVHISSDSDDSGDGIEDKVKEEKVVDMERLRAERLKRESIEKKRAEQLMAKLRGETVPEERTEVVPSIKQKYNSQYNPELAKQNFSHLKKP